MSEPRRCGICWGSHGCKLERGHEGPHLCCCAVPDWKDYIDQGGYEDEEGVLNVGAPPYYGPETYFYGDE